MIPKTAEYALRAVVLLARAPDQAHSAEEIAESVRVPRRYADLFTEIPEQRFRLDMSSSEIRARLVGSS